MRTNEETKQLECTQSRFLLFFFGVYVAFLNDLFRYFHSFCVFPKQNEEEIEKMLDMIVVVINSLWIGRYCKTRQNTFIFNKKKEEKKCSINQQRQIKFIPINQTTKTERKYRHAGEREKGKREKCCRDE